MIATTWHDYVCVSFVEIGDIVGVADVTIRQWYRCAAELFPTDFQFTTPVDKLPNLWFFFYIFPSFLMFRCYLFKQRLFGL